MLEIGPEFNKMRKFDISFTLKEIKKMFLLLGVMLRF